MGAFESFMNSLGPRPEIGLQAGEAIEDEEVTDKMKEVEASVRKCLDTVQGKVSQDVQNVPEIMAIINNGLRFAKENEQHLTSVARVDYSGLYILKSSLLWNPFNPFDSMDQLDFAIWVSKSPHESLVRYSLYWYRCFFDWCHKNFVESSRIIVDFFEKKLRRLNKLIENDPVGSASAILMYSTQCCELSTLILKNDRKLIKKVTVVNVIVQHGTLALKQNNVESAKRDVERALTLGGDSVQLYLLISRVDLHVLKSLPTSSFRFPKQGEEVLKHVSKGLAMLAEEDSEMKAQFLAVKTEAEEIIRQAEYSLLKVKVPKSKTVDDDEEFPEIAKGLQRQKELQEKKREAYLEKKAKEKTKHKFVTRKRYESISSPNRAPAVERKEEEEKEPNEQRKSRARKQSTTKKEEADQHYLANTEDGVYKVDARGFIKGTNVKPKQKHKPKLKQENHVSREIYSLLIQRYKIHLGCDLCISTPKSDESGTYKVSLQSGSHNCLENQLLLSKINEQNAAWIIIRPCPRRFKFGPNPALCDSFLLGEECMEKSLCPNPHSNEELELWTKYFKSKISLQRFIDDLRESPLRAKFDTERLCEVFGGSFRFVCKSCFQESNQKTANGKKHHQPLCENEETPHAWNEDNQMLVFVRNGTELDPSKITSLEDGGHDGCDSEDQTAAEVRLAVANLRNFGIEKVQVVEESKRYWQKREKGSYMSTYERLYVRTREDSVCSSGNGSTADMPQNGPDSDVEEDPRRVYDSDLDDVMTVCDSDDEDVRSCDENDDGYEDWTNYYETNTEEELREMLREQPGRYKRCIIHLDGPYTAKCKVLDSKAHDDDGDDERRQSEDSHLPTGTGIPEVSDTEIVNRRCTEMGTDDTDGFAGETESLSDGNRVFREIEIRGRANCGPSFSGDEVVVELKKTKELGDDADEVYRGTVVGILKRHTDRKAYTFVCRVDSHIAHLMRPINGVAPKIHVVHSIITSKYPEKKNELVAKYHMEDEELKLDKIVRLDPERRRDMLFVVKYLQWLPKCMYPLGYVTKIIPSGERLEDSQKVLNLLHQVPTKPSEKCSEAAKQLLESGIDSENALLLDMRNWFTLSIDPSDCKDVDDALTLRKTEFGFEVGVHIADVSQFVEKDGVIDRNARKRVTSYYPATKKVYHMLPAELSENLCSLKEGEERLALSVFVTISSDGDVRNQSTNIRRTKIQNNRTMTYEEAQAYIDSMPSSQPTFLDERNEKSIVLHLNYLAKKLRAKRINRGQYYYQEDNPFAVEKCHDAHRLVEEFMILANIQVANFLVSKFPECTPIRRQLSPNSEEIGCWIKKNNDLINCSFYFNQFECLSQQDCEDVTENASANLSILMQTLKRLKMATEKGDLQAVKTIVGSEWLHPYHSLAMIDWWGLQETAEFVPSGDLDGLDPDHFSLQVPFYVQFTSPIRRYMDIVIHRLVKCALEHEPASYSLADMRTLCDKVNDVSQIAKKYHKASKLLELTVLLTTPFYLPCFVEGFDDDSLTLTIPHLGKVSKSQRVLKYSALSVSDKPDVKDKVELLWEKRLYDADSRSSLKLYARKRHNARRVIRIESNRYTAHVMASQWHHLMDAISNEDVITARKLLVEIMEGVSQEKQCRTEQPEVTSEMYNDAVMVKHHVRFSQKLTRGSVMAVQFGAECMNGFLQPTIRTVNLTPEKDVCVEHRIDPVKCFAELATDKVLPHYSSVDQYKNIWLPILAMEAASKTVAAGDTILCNNVRVSLCKRNDQYYGKLRLPLAFCKKRKIHIFNNSKDGEEDSNDFLCIRYHCKQEKVHDTGKTVCTSFVRNVWVGHAVAMYVHVTDSQDVVVKFRLQLPKDSSDARNGGEKKSAPPKDFLDAGKSGEKCTVEFLTKLLPDRRMEDAVNSANESSDLCKKIILGQRVDDLPEITKYPQHDTYDVEADPSTKIYKNNASQTDAIRKSLQGKFTLIQGPPGTGKTVTGIKLAYWFVRMNKETRASGGTHGQVLYCGPSNSSVDVAAKWLKKLGQNCPKIIRVYSQALEKQVFPIPRDNLQIGSMGGRHYELIDKDENKDIALHHIIRQKSKKFSAKIRAFDRLFKTNWDTPDQVSDEQVEEYEKLVTDAAIHELKEYDVILCTCSASVSPRMLRSANIHQIITDECGMCMEPETLIPLQAFKSTRQVVLIGDHKQLQPIVMNSVAKGLGLDISLFERYKDRAIMLTEQYRMHPRICEFPSNQFYDKKLTTAENHDCIGERQLRIWPNRYYPMVFCHAEGAEKILSVSTEDGNERSRSNELERREAVRIFFNLVNRYNVDQEKITILSQYKAQCTAIEHNLKELGYEHPNVGTVIASQGDEWDYVILSLVRSMPQYEIEKKPSIGWCQKNMGFIIDEHQINVALTRARLGLIIIGNKHLLRCDNMWRNLLHHFERYRLVKDTEYFLPTGKVLPLANRLQQGPQIIEDGGETLNYRFQNQNQGPRNYPRNFQQSENRTSHNFQQVGNNPSRERRSANEDENDSKHKKSFQKSTASKGSS